MNLKSFSILILIILFCQSGFAQTIFVSNTGNDANNGSREKPVATLETARNLARTIHQKDKNQLVTISIASGNYYMTKPLELLASEKDSDQNLSFLGDPARKPVFYGGYRIRSFRKVTDSLWKADVPQVRETGVLFEQLYINGRRAERAKSPNTGFYNPVSIEEKIIKQDKNADSAILTIKVPVACFQVLSALNQEELIRTIIKICHNWDNTIKHIQTFNKEDSTITIAGQAMKPWNKITTGSIFTIEDFSLALDKPGEWFLEKNGTLYYRPQSGDMIQNVRVIAPSLEKLVIIKGDEKIGKPVSNITFRNISFQCNAYRLPQNGFEPVQAAGLSSAQIEADFADHITFTNCEFLHTGAYAVWFRRSCSESRFNHNYFQDMGAGGIKIGEWFIPKDTTLISSHITVNNNILHSGGQFLSCAVGIAILNGYDNKLTHNEIGDFRYTGISCGFIWGYDKNPAVRNIISNNHIHHLGWGEMSDMGGIYMLGVSPGTTISHNLIHDIYALDYGGWGIYTDEGSSNILIRDNLVYKCKSAGFHQHYGRDNMITNNIFANNIKSQLQATKAEKHRSFTFKNNIIYYDQGDLLSNNWDKFSMDTDSNAYWKEPDGNVLFKMEDLAGWQKKDKDLHSLIENPNFVNPETGNFEIKNKELLKRINFKPFDYTQAGVYGNSAWKEKARLSEKIQKAFEEKVRFHAE